jgi:peptidoglycan/LPS O-acetylase OafA/YrhL
MGYLRILLALGVVLFHSGPLFGYIGMNGMVAVHIFFIISGFYMTYIIKNKYSKTKRPFYAFLSNRILRIYPIYWLVLLLTIVLFFTQIKNLDITSIISGLLNIIPHYINTRKPIGVIEDVTLIIRSDYLKYGMIRDNMLLVSPAWTLVHEMVFYLCAFFLVFLRKRYLLLLTILSIMIHILSSHYYGLSGDRSFSYNFIPANFFFFLFGIFSYNFYEWLTANKIKPKYFFHLSVIFLFAVFLWNYIPDIKLGWIIIKEWGFYLATPFFIPLIFLSFNRTPLNNIMADLSYPVYISHLLIIYFLQTVLNLQPSFSLYSFWILCITLVFSVAIVYLIERPIDKFRQRRIKKGKQN